MTTAKPFPQTFCILPWISSMIYTDGHHHFCCIATEGEIKDDQKNQSLSIHQISISEARNSPYMCHIRQQMLENKPLEACQICLEQEQWGKKSYRQHFNEEWQQTLGTKAFQDIVNDSIANDYKVGPQLLYLDLRLGNLCNLKCRMCNPINSSNWAREYNTLYRDQDQFKTIMDYAFGGNISHCDNSNWPTSEELWNEVYSFIPGLKKIYLTGGEPTLIRQNTTLLQKIIEQGRQDQVIIFFNTNATNISQQFLELISEFKQVQINISIDGIDQMNQYIRFPSKWANVATNIEKIARIPQVILNFTPVFQIYNLFALANIFNYTDRLSRYLKRKIGIDVLYNIHPHHLDIRILPLELRQQAWNQLKELQRLKESPFIEQSLLENSLKGLKGILEEEQLENHIQLQNQFWTFTNILDQSRNQSLKDVAPEIYHFFTKELNVER